LDKTIVETHKDSARQK